MAGARPYRNPRFAGDFCGLGGHSWVLVDRDRSDGTTFYRVAYVSGGGDIYFKSPPIMVAEHAEAACRVFASFVGAATDPTPNWTAPEVQLA